MAWQPNDIAIDQLILESNAHALSRMYKALAEHTPKERSWAEVIRDGQDDREGNVTSAERDREAPGSAQEWLGGAA